MVTVLANLTAATSKRPYGRINDTWCATPTFDFVEVLLKVEEKSFEKISMIEKQWKIMEMNH